MHKQTKSSGHTHNQHKNDVVARSVRDVRVLLDVRSTCVLYVRFIYCSTSISFVDCCCHWCLSIVVVNVNGRNRWVDVNGREQWEITTDLSSIVSLSCLLSFVVDVVVVDVSNLHDRI